MSEVPTGAVYRELAAPRGLESQIACLWVQRAPSGVVLRPQLAVPNGSAEIACEPACGDVRLVGAVTAPRRAQPAAGQTLVGVRFRPGVAPAVLGAAPEETKDLSVPLECSWGRAGARLGERMAEAGSTIAALALLVRALRPRIESMPEPTFAAEVRERLQPWNARTVSAVGRELFLSDRQLRRRTAAMFGFGPKELQRILRFQVFLALVQGRRAEEVELASLAAQLGYADQSHLSRDSRRLTGLPPRRFLRELAESCGPNHDHSASYASLRVRFLQDVAR